MGIIFVIVAIRNAQRKIQAYRLGDATTGVLVDVYRDQSVTVNGRNPWTLENEFNVVGAVYSVKATDQAAATIYLNLVFSWNQTKGSKGNHRAWAIFTRIPNLPAYEKSGRGFAV